MLNYIFSFLAWILYLMFQGSEDAFIDQKNVELSMKGVGKVCVGARSSRHTVTGMDMTWCFVDGDPSKAKKRFKSFKDIIKIRKERKL